MPFDTFANEKIYSHPQRIALTMAACAATTLLAIPLLGRLDLANIVMLFLLTVLVVAVKLGRNAAILASVISVLSFDIFFVPPRFSLAVSNIQYLITFAVMLVTALTTTHLTSILRQRAQEAIRREQQTQSLYQLAKQLAGSLTVQQVVEITNEFVRSQVAATSVVLLPDVERDTLTAAGSFSNLPIEVHLARVAFEGGNFVRSNEVRGMCHAFLYFPLKAPMRIRGVLAVAFDEESGEFSDESLSLLEALTVQYGFKDDPDIPAALMMCAESGVQLDMMDTSFFLGRETLIPKLGSEMAYWRELLFIAMFRNAGSATAFFKIPSNRVVELGSQVVL